MAEFVDEPRSQPNATAEMIRRARYLLRMSRNVTVATVNRDGTPRSTFIAGFFHSELSPDRPAVTMLSWGDKRTRHIGNLAATGGLVAITVGQTYSGQNILNLSGEMHPVPADEVPAALDTMNTRRGWWRMAHKRLEEFAPDDQSHPTVLYRTGIIAASMPASYTDNLGGGWATLRRH